MRRIILLFFAMAIICGAFISCQKKEDMTIVIENITAGIEHDDAFEEYTVTRMGPDKEHPFECYCAGGIANTWATVVVEFRSPSVPEVIVEDFPQNDNCNSILVKCDGMGDGKWKAVIWTTVGFEAKVTIVNKDATLCFGISIVGDVGWTDPGLERLDKITEDDFLRAASYLGVPVAVVKALDEVLSDNKGGFFAMNRPAIQFEGHIFWKELLKKGIDPRNYVRGNEDILYEKWTKAYYKNGMSEYQRLERAERIDETAARCATCWGAYKLMGYNYEKCECGDARSFVNRMMESRGSQMDLFVSYLLNTGGNKYLRSLDWAGFARYYDRDRYARDKFDEKLEQAYAKYAAGTDQ